MDAAGLEFALISVLCHRQLVVSITINNGTNIILAFIECLPFSPLKEKAKASGLHVSRGQKCSSGPFITLYFSFRHLCSGLYIP